MERNVFHINPPTDDSTAYILLISRGSGPFGSAPPIVFAVDGLSLLASPDQKPLALQGFVKQEDGSGRVVIQFPVDTPYVMVERKAVSMLTEIEAMRLQDSDRAEVQAAFPERKSSHQDPLAPEGGDEKIEAIPVEISHPGQYA